MRKRAVAYKARAIKAEREIIVQAFDKGSARGATWEDPAETDAIGELWAAERHDVVAVTHSRTNKRRAGIGTGMYEIAAKLACKVFGKPLGSDTARSVASDGFWRKQVNKGRARCTSAAVDVSDRYDPEDRIAGRNACERYVLRCPAPQTLGQSRKPAK